MLMQNFDVTNKEHYGMSWYFLEWSINICDSISSYPQETSYIALNTLIAKAQKPQF